MSGFLNAKYLRVISSERWETADGEVRYQRTEVGRAFWSEASDGGRYLSIKIFAGLSVSGQLAVFPPRPREEGEPAPQVRGGGRRGGRGRGGAAAKPHPNEPGADGDDVPF